MQTMWQRSHGNQSWRKPRNSVLRTTDGKEKIGHHRKMSRPLLKGQVARLFHSSA